MALDMTTADAILKQLYVDGLTDLTYQDHPFLALVPKDENFVGDALTVACKIANPQGRSTTFASALANKGASSLKKFVLTHVRDYSLVSMDNLTLMASASKKGGLASALEVEVGGGIASLAHNLSTSLFRNGGGALGRVSSTSTTSLTLTDVNDVVNFDVGMEVTTSTTDGTSGSAYTDSATITAINRDTGVLTTDSNWSTQISSIADNDYIFPVGDFGGKLTGLAGWIPDSAPSASESFFGLDRSTDATRLGGVRVSSTDVSGLPLEEKILHACARLGREGGRPDTCFVSFEKFRDLEISLMSKVQYADVESAGVGFSAIMLRGPKGSVKVIPDGSCPNNRAYVLTLNTWKLHSLGPATQILERDGKLLREASSDAYECRIAFYGNLSCDAPGWNAVIDLS